MRLPVPKGALPHGRSGAVRRASFSHFLLCGLPVPALCPLQHFRRRCPTQLFLSPAPLSCSPLSRAPSSLRPLSFIPSALFPAFAPFVPALHSPLSFLAPPPASPSLPAFLSEDFSGRLRRIHSCTASRASRLFSRLLPLLPPRPFPAASVFEDGQTAFALLRPAAFF